MSVFYSTQKQTSASFEKTHTGEKPFKCDVCQFSAAIKGNVVRHMRTHTKEKLLSNSDRPSNTCTQKQILNIKDIDDVNSTLPSTDDERDHMKIDQLVDPYNSANVQAHLSSNEHQIKEKSAEKIKRESLDDGVQRWIVINSDIKQESDVM